MITTAITLNTLPIQPQSVLSLSLSESALLFSDEASTGNRKWRQPLQTLALRLFLSPHLEQVCMCESYICVRKER